MDNQTKIELTDPNEIADFIDFRKHKQEMLSDGESWKQVKKFARNMQYGTFSLTVKDGKPVRIDNAIQQLLIVI